MPPAQHDEQTQKNSNPIETKKKSKKKNAPKKQKKLNFFKYLYLFSLVFLAALWGLSHLIKSYSPDIDVTIGNNEAFTLNDDDVDMEIKTIDERLKWIQMEDDLPSVSIRSIEKNEKDKKKDRRIEEKQKKYKDEIVEKQTKQTTTAVSAPAKNENVNQNFSFNEIPAKDVIKEKITQVKPRTPVTRVYLGNYPTFEAANEVQNKIQAMDSSISPFVKSVNGHYIVQIGSFSDSERAGVLAEKLTAIGYYPKINYEN